MKKQIFKRKDIIMMGDYDDFEQSSCPSYLMENANSVCFVEKINKIESIEGADKIELITIGNYSCIVEKGKYLKEELIIIAVTDAVIPEKIAKDLNIKNYLKNGDKVKTIKLKGVYSECVTIPTSYIEKNIKLYEGKDMMSILGIYKYEPEVKTLSNNERKEKNVINNNFKVYYKFPNIKNTKNIFNNNDIIQVTRKIHGTNARFGLVKKEKISFWSKIKKLFKINDILDDYDYIYGSHNVQKNDNNGGVWEKISNKFLIKDRLINFISKNKINIGNGIILYGEIYGDGIQPKYNYGLKNDISILFFDTYLNNRYISHKENEKLYDNLSLPYTIPLYVGKYDESKINEFVKDNFINKTNIPHEGVVIKEISGDRKKVVKVINPDYLVNNGKNNNLDSAQEFNH